MDTDSVISTTRLTRVGCRVLPKHLYGFSTAIGGGSLGPRHFEVTRSKVHTSLWAFHRFATRTAGICTSEATRRGTSFSQYEVWRGRSLQRGIVPKNESVLHTAQSSQLVAGLSFANDRKAIERRGEVQLHVVLGYEVGRRAIVVPAGIRKHAWHGLLQVQEGPAGCDEHWYAATCTAERHGFGHLVRRNPITGGNEAETVRHRQGEILCMRHASGISNHVREFLSEVDIAHLPGPMHLGARPQESSHIRGGLSSGG